MAQKHSKEGLSRKAQFFVHFLVLPQRRIKKFSMRRMNLVCSIVMQSWCRTLVLVVFNATKNETAREKMKSLQKFLPPEQKPSISHADNWILFFELALKGSGKMFGGRRLMQAKSVTLWAKSKRTCPWIFRVVLIGRLTRSKGTSKADVSAQCWGSKTNPHTLAKSVDKDAPRRGYAVRAILEISALSPKLRPFSWD